MTTKHNAGFAKRVTKPGAYRFARGLFLRVSVNEASSSVRRSWIQRITIDGQRTDKGLGSLEDVTVEEAIDLAYENRRAMRRGDNPFPDKRRKLYAPTVPTFAEAVRTVVVNRSAQTWSARVQRDRDSVLNEYVLPKLGTMPVDAIRIRHVEAVLKPIWLSKPSVANTARTLIRATLDWALAKEHRRDANPADKAILELLPKRSRNGGPKHHDAVPHADVREAIHSIVTSGAALATKLAFEFMIHTAARTGEAQGARWSEIDIDARTWTIPAARMKAGLDHCAPLSVQALAIIERARGLRRPGRGQFVFDTGRGKGPSDSTFRKLAHNLKLSGTPHGFRSSFSSWCADNGKPADLREAALAHVERNAVVAAYQRSDLLERRRSLMQSWSDYVAPMRKRPRTD